MEPLSTIWIVLIAIGLVLLCGWGCGRMCGRR
jgi:hypothetical protein